MIAKKQNQSVKIGSNVEKWVLNKLQQAGLKVVNTNFRSKFGEIDLIMQDNKCLIFFEVRYRKNDRYGTGAQSITQAKQRKIITTAQYFLTCNPWGEQIPCRFDVVSVCGLENSLKMEWIKSAFEVQ